MIRIFLAHAKEDKAKVFELYDRLKQRGYQPWLDKKDLLGGQLWDDEIKKAIDSSDIFIACLSKRSVKKQGYVQKEFRMALQKCGNMPEGKIYLIPLRLDDCEIPNLRQREYGLNIRDYQWVDLFEPDGFEQLVRSIDHYFPVPKRSDSSKLDNPNSDEAYFDRLNRLQAADLEVMNRFAQETMMAQAMDKGSESPKQKTIDLGNGVTLEVMCIPGGTFLMGSSENEEISLNSEKPQHKVTVPEFWMGKYPLTQAQYSAVTGKNPSHFKGDDLPVEQVSWYDAVEFCKQLSRKTGKHYRLPSEAEWEYACRAGTNTCYFFGNELTGKQANFKGSKTIPVGKYPANAFGLYDMHGNVWEWCQDYWHGNYDGAPTDGSAWIKDGYDEYRVMRGGSWAFNLVLCRSARRYDYRPGSCYDYIGFRVVSAPSGSLK